MEATELVFTEDEWNAAIPKVVADMTDFLMPYRTPLHLDAGDHAVGGGTGSYLKLGGRIFVLTNAHIATLREGGRRLMHQLYGSEQLHFIVGDHLKFGGPLDLALLPVDADVWAGTHGSCAVDLDQLAWSHVPVPTELLTFVGFPGDDVGFHFGTVTSKAKCLTGREVTLPPDDGRFESRFHFGLDYKPDLSTDVIAGEGLSRPPGLSGSTVWNTCFVEARLNDIPWTPELAKVTGVVWGWPSNVGCLVATRAEYVRSFLLGALSKLDAMASGSAAPGPKADIAS